VLAQRHPDRFMPRYSMVTFTRMPYAQALARGAAQEQLLRELTAGKTRVDEIDLEGADRAVQRRIEPLAS
jgi:kynurenine 3-monooxygenase